MCILPSLHRLVLCLLVFPYPPVSFAFLTVCRCEEVVLGLCTPPEAIHTNWTSPSACFSFHWEGVQMLEGWGGGCLSLCCLGLWCWVVFICQSPPRSRRLWMGSDWSQVLEMESYFEMSELLLTQNLINELCTVCLDWLWPFLNTVQACKHFFRWNSFL